MARAVPALHPWHPPTLIPTFLASPGLFPHQLHLSTGRRRRRRDEAFEELLGFIPKASSREQSDHQSQTLTLSHISSTFPSDSQSAALPPASASPSCLQP